MARILVAEDSATDLAFVQEILKGSSHEILIAQNGREAEEMGSRAMVDSGEESGGAGQGAPHGCVDRSRLDARCQAAGAAPWLR